MLGDRGDGFFDLAAVTKGEVLLFTKICSSIADATPLAVARKCPMAALASAALLRDDGDKVMKPAAKLGQVGA